MEQSITLRSGLKMRYNVSGEGSPVIIMHGWGCNSSTMALFEQVAAEQHKVFNLNMPGFGGSDEPREVWGVEDYTRALEEFVSLCGIDEP
ncbi:MAG: alpha/beta fold hydrolase, partial [Muribaculaceae bacterium]